MSIDVLTDRIAMSQRERDILKVMTPLLQGQRTQAEAARLRGLSIPSARCANGNVSSSVTTTPRRIAARSDNVQR
jgi:hypothetical protein